MNKFEFASRSVFLNFVKFITLNWKLKCHILIICNKSWTQLPVLFLQISKQWSDYCWSVSNVNHSRIHQIICKQFRLSDNFSNEFSHEYRCNWLWNMKRLYFSWSLLIVVHYSGVFRQMNVFGLDVFGIASMTPLILSICLQLTIT